MRRLVLSVYYFLSFWAVAQSQTVHVRQFTMENGLSQMKCNALVRDSLGYLWIGTRDGLNRFDGSLFKSYTTDDGLLHNRIHDVTVKENGDLIIVTAGGIQVFNGQSFESYPISLPEVVYYTMYYNETFWIAEHQNKRLIRFKNQELKEFTLSKNGVYPLYDSRSDQVLLINGHNKEYDVYNTEDLREPLYTDIENVKFLYPQQDGRHNYLVTLYDGMVKVTDSSIESVSEGAFLEALPAYSIICRELCSLLNPDRNDLYSEYVNDFIDDIIRPQKCLFDIDSSLWISSENGLWHITHPSMTHFDQTETPYVWSVQENGNNQIVLGSYGYGLKMMDTDGMLRNLNKNGEYTVTHAGSAMSRDGRALFTGFRGILSTDSIYDLPYARLHATHDILYDSSRNHYVIGALGGILITRDLKQYAYLDTTAGIHDNLYIQSVEMDRHGNYWLGSYSGLSVYNPERDHFEQFTSQNKLLPATGVFSSFQDYRGTMWIGSNEGLLYKSESSKEIHKIPSTLLHQPIKSIIDFNDEYILLGTKQSIYLFSLDAFYQDGSILLQEINKSYGFSGIEPGFNGFFKDSKRRIWMTSASDLSLLSAAEFKMIDRTTRPRITDIDTIKLPFTQPLSSYRFDDNALSIRVDAIGTFKPKLVGFSYRLDDNEWSDWTYDPTLSLTGLRHGDHTLEVVTGPTDVSKSSLVSDKVHLKIDLPFYQRGWFIPCLSSLSFLFMGLALYNVLKVRRAQRRYEEQQIQLRYFRNQLLLSEMNPHFVFNVLASIQNKILTQRTKDASDYLIKLADIIRNFLKASHQGNQLDGGYAMDHTLEREIELINQFVEFEHDKSDDHFEYEIQIDESLEINSLYIPPMIIQPFVENAIIHGLLLADYKGTLTISFRHQDDVLLCEIQDNGVGRKRSEDMYQKRFKTKKSYGIKIIKERIDLLNQLGHSITLHITDAEPQGTIVRLHFSIETE